ncbi:Rieske (2Fe-2S) protein [Rhizorhabdus argentea]|uniref:Rieske (2Fe-2S) protein n=1 Tax=Rhizorhabdus argentea TaxID=1387174 RepID=UPI0030EB6F99
MTTTYVQVCKLSDLKEGEFRLFTVASREVLLMLVRKTVYCVANRCSHMAKPLDGGRLLGYHLICPFHSAQFDVRTGKSGGFPASRSIQTFPVHMHHGDVMIGIDVKHP